MKRASRLLVGVLGVAILALSSPAVAPGGAAKAEPAETARVQTLEVRVQPWHLMHHSGAELYGELCASCHGVDGAGNGPAAAGLEIPPPALNRLRDAGIPKRHWAYVVESPCEDRHHRAPGGAETMPCWQRIFRHSLGNDAAALLVTAKLVDHLEAIQR